MQHFLRFLFFCLISIGYSVSSFASDYIFTGNGDWNDPANWEGGFLPGTNGAGIIYIKGSARTSKDTVISNIHSCAGEPGCDMFYINGGTLIVAEGGTLTLNNSTQFGNWSSIIVNGTLINATNFEGYPGNSITVNGTMINRLVFSSMGTVTINNGGKIQNTSYFSLEGPPGVIWPDPGQLVINSGGEYKNEAVFKAGKLTNQGLVTNSARMAGNVAVTGSLSNAGTLAPGNSPGVFAISGDYTAAATAVHEFEVGGTAASSYDHLDATGNVYLDGTLNLSLINGFTPTAANADLPIITGTIHGTFATVIKPAQYQVVYNANSVVLRYLSTLPVKFSRLDVKREGAGATLNWEVQSQVNVSRYDVEKSFDGNNFVLVGRVAAASIGKYQFTDHDAGEKTFYRIRSVDSDGKSSYSAVVALSSGKNQVALTVFPSPASGAITIQHAPATAESKLFISTIEGRTLKTITPVIGSNATTVDLSTFSSGTMILQYKNGADQQSVKFVKR